MAINETEEMLIATLLIYPKRVLDCVCSPDDFVSHEMRDIFLAIKAVQKNDFLQISKQSGVPIADLSKLTDNNVPMSAGQASRLIRGAAQKKRLAAGLYGISQEKLLPVEDMLSDMLTLYRAEKSAGDKDYSVDAVINRFNEVQRENKNRGSLGLKTGFDFLDENYISLVPGHMWVIGALPGTGKTNTLIQMLANLACRCVVFSTEMTEEQLTARYLANKTGIDAKVILSGGIHSTLVNKIEYAKSVMAKKDLLIIDDVKQAEEIERIVRLENMKKPVDVVFVDYVQHLKIRGKRTKYEASSEISHLIQDLAKSCRLTMVCFSQVTLSSHKDYTGNAQYKGAGDFAEDCDVGVRLMSAKDEQGKILWTTEKNRHGIRPIQMFRYHGGYTRIAEIDHDANRPKKEQTNG